MFENRFLAGIVAGLPVSLLCVAYLVARRDAVLAVLTEGTDTSTLSPEAWTALMLAAGVVIGPALGFLAAFVYGAVPSDHVYLALAFVLATAFSLAAVATHTPMAVEKVVLNYAVAVCLGLVLPRLLGA